MSEQHPETLRPLYETEQIKLRANAFHRASIASFVVGVAMPLAAAALDVGDFRATVGAAALVAGLAFWLALCVLLHWMGQRTLERLN